MNMDGNVGDWVRAGNQPLLPFSTQADLFPWQPCSSSDFPGLNRREGEFYLCSLTPKFGPQRIEEIRVCPGTQELWAKGHMHQRNTEWGCWMEASEKWSLITRR